MPARGSARSRGLPGASPCAVGERAIAALRWHKRRRASTGAALRRARRALGKAGYASRGMLAAARPARIAGALRGAARGAGVGALITDLFSRGWPSPEDVAWFLLARAPRVLERLVPRLSGPVTARRLSESALAVSLAGGRLPKTLDYIMDECLRALSYGSDPASGYDTPDWAERMEGRLADYAQDMCSAAAERQPSGRGYGLRVGIPGESVGTGAGTPLAPAAKRPPAGPRSLPSLAQERRAVATIILAVLARIAIVLWRMDDVHSLPEALLDLLRCVAHLRTLRAG